MLTLRKMTEQEYVEWSAASRIAYADDKMRANNLTKEEASKLSDDSFNRLLPEGLQSPNSFLFTLDIEGVNLGYFWFSLMGPENNRKAFIYDVKIHEPFQGKGYGRKIMQMGEEKARNAGAMGIGLHVFGFNERAIKLYQSLNYETTDLVMEKRF